MKKIAVLIAGVGAVVIAFYFLSPSPDTSARKSEKTKQTLSPPKTQSQTKLAPPAQPDADTHQAVNYLLERLWAAAREDNQAGVPAALKLLNDYLVAHPESINDVLAAFKSDTAAKRLS